MKNPPFKIEEDGWGEFEVELVMTDLSGRDHPMKHDLNFSQERYENKQVIVFKNPKGDLATALRASGAVPGHAAAEMNGKKGGRASGIGGADGEVGKKKKKMTCEGSIWIHWQRDCRSSERMIFFRWCRWCMTTSWRKVG